VRNTKATSEHKVQCGTPSLLWVRIWAVSGMDKHQAMQAIAKDCKITHQRTELWVNSFLSRANARCCLWSCRPGMLPTGCYAWPVVSQAMSSLELESQKALLYRNGHHWSHRACKSKAAVKQHMTLNSVYQVIIQNKHCYKQNTYTLTVDNDLNIIGKPTVLTIRLYEWWLQGWRLTPRCAHWCLRSQPMKQTPKLRPLDVLRDAHRHTRAQ
jgi:hypothetical protein